MKIEKVSENKIRCTLTREDLEARQIEIKELLYGSEKARMLFQEMVQKASRECDFEVEDMPLMIEAIPSASDRLVLVISKVEYPEELDVRYSRYSEPDQGYFSDESAEEKADEEKTVAEAFQTEKVRAFASDGLEELIRLAVALDGKYWGESSLYKDPEHRQYILVLRGENEHPGIFEAVCIIASEYARQIPFRSSMNAFYEEHMTLMIREQAVEQLQLLKK